jgi:AraC-like DNA-binding protein
MTCDRLSSSLPPTAGGGFARLAAEHALATGADLSTLLRSVGITREQIEDKDARIGVKEQIAFVEGVANMLQRDRLGFEIAQSFDLRKIGLLYYVAASSATLVEAMRRVERFSTIANEAVLFRCSFAKGFRIDLQYAGVARHSDRHQIEFFLAVLVRLCRTFTAKKLTPQMVSVSHSRSGGRPDFERFFGCSVQFQAERDEVIFGEECKGLPLTAADAYLNEMLVRYCEETLSFRRAGRASLRTMVENAAAPLLPHGKPRASEIAKQLHVSERTLARRLSADGLTFARVIDEMRRDLALRYLDDPALTISQAAWLLGYQEIAAFSHAVRRWTGRTPTEHRPSRKK